MIFWCRDQDMFCATWYDICDTKTKICFVPHGMTIVVKEKSELLKKLSSGYVVLHGMTFAMQKKT